jgi:hypothetical protein
LADRQKNDLEDVKVQYNRKKDKILRNLFLDFEKSKLVED